MAQLQLKSIRIRNWATVKEAEIALPEKGLVLVTGSNLASGGKMDSVGSGKTALGEAISRALTGVPGRYTKLGDYSTDDKGNTYIDIQATLNSQILRVEMGYKCKELSKSGEGLRYTLGTDQVERGHLNETREELSRVIGVTPELAQWTVFVDGDNLKFNKLSEKQAVDILMCSLQQPPWTSFAEKASKSLQTAKRDLATDLALNEEAKRRHQAAISAEEIAGRALKAAQQAFDVEVAKNQDNITRAENDKVQLETRVAELVKKLSDIRKTLKQIEDEKASKQHELEMQRNKVDREVVQYRDKRDAIHAQRAEAQARVRQEEQALTKLRSVPKNCPTCGKTWDKAHGKEEIARQEIALQEASAVLSALSHTLGLANETLRQYEATIQEINQDIRNLGAARQTVTLSRDYEQSERDLNRTKDNVRNMHTLLEGLQRGPDNSALVRAQAVLEERQEAKAASAAAIEESATKMFQSQEVLKIVDYWNKAFGPFGIPNMVLGEVISPLNEIARRISLLMTGGTIEVTYSTTRALVSGSSKAELVVNVNNKLGSKKLAGNSKGESGLSNLIIAETLSEVGSVSNRIGYRWYDEVLNSQDPAVRKSILSYMRQVAHSLGILIFVVDHHQETANYADHILVAEKAAGGTTFRWA